MRVALRTLGMLVGIIGAVIALIVNVLYSSVNDLTKLSGSANGHPTHGFIGVGLFVVGLVGALLAIPSPITAAVLMALAAIGFGIIIPGFSFFAIPFLGIGAILAFLDRKKKPQTT